MNKKILIAVASLAGLLALSGLVMALNSPDDDGDLLGGFRRQRGPSTIVSPTFSAVGADVAVDTNNLRSLGSFGLAFKNIYASSTAYLANVSVVNSGSTTSTIDIGELAGAGCVNMIDAAGAAASYFIDAAGTMIVEQSACK